MCGVFRTHTLDPGGMTWARGANAIVYVLSPPVASTFPYFFVNTAQKPKSAASEAYGGCLWLPPPGSGLLGAWACPYKHFTVLCRMIGRSYMRQTKPHCAHCNKATSCVKLYWSTRNLARRPLKTYYCDHCAKIIVPARIAQALDT